MWRHNHALSFSLTTQPIEMCQTKDVWFSSLSTLTRLNPPLPPWRGGWSLSQLYMGALGKLPAHCRALRELSGVFAIVLRGTSTNVLCSDADICVALAVWTGLFLLPKTHAHHTGLLLPQDLISEVGLLAHLPQSRFHSRCDLISLSEDAAVLSTVTSH